MKRYRLAGILLLLLASVGLAAQNTTTGRISSSAASCSTSNTACLILPLPNQAGAVGIAITGTFSGTLEFEASADNGSSWVSINGYPPASTSAATSTTSAGTWRFAVSGMTHIRARASSFASGSASVQIQASPAAASLNLGSGGGGGGSPGGADTDVQYNDGGNFGGDSSFTWDADNKRLMAGNASTSTPVGRIYLPSYYDASSAPNGGGPWIVGSVSSALWDTTYDNLFFRGYNSAADGGIVDATKPSWSENWEMDYFDGSKHVFERHENINWPSGVCTSCGQRIQGVQFNLNDQTDFDWWWAIGTHTGDAFTYYDISGSSSSLKKIATFSRTYGFYFPGDGWADNTSPLVASVDRNAALSSTTQFKFDKQNDQWIVGDGFRTSPAGYSAFGGSNVSSTHQVYINCVTTNCLAASAGTRTSTFNFLNFGATLNNISTRFNTILVNLTNTASDSNSTFMDLQVGGSSKFKVKLDGTLITTGGLQINSSYNGLYSFNSGVLQSSTYSDVVSLFGTCLGVLYYDGTCPVPTTDGYANPGKIAQFDGSGNLAGNIYIAHEFQLDPAVEQTWQFNDEPSPTAPTSSTSVKLYSDGGLPFFWRGADAGGYQVAQQSGSFSDTDCVQYDGSTATFISTGSPCGSGGGNVTVYLPMDCRAPRTQSLAGNSFWTVTALTNYDWGHWEFKPTVDGTIYCYVRLPENMASSPAAAVQLVWGANNTASSKAVVWQVQGVLLANSTTFNASFNTAETASTASVSTTAYLQTRTSITLSNTTVAQSDNGKILLIGVSRVGSSGSDTLTTLNALLDSVYLAVTESL